MKDTNQSHVIIEIQKIYHIRITLKVYSFCFGPPFMFIIIVGKTVTVNLSVIIAQFFKNPQNLQNRHIFNIRSISAFRGRVHLKRLQIRNHEPQKWYIRHFKR